MEDHNSQLGRERMDDLRQLVGERHRGQLELVPDGLALEHPARPAAQSIVMFFVVAKGTAGACTSTVRR